MNVQVTRTRQAIGTQLAAFWAAAGYTWDLTTRHGLQAYAVEGDALTAGQAADRYLPGGFDGSYGGNGHRPPLYTVSETVMCEIGEGLLKVDVLTIRGARNTEDGYLALVRDTTGALHVVPS